MSKRIVILVLLVLVGCKKSERLQRYQLEGTVLSVEANVGEVTVKHKAIPGLMEAMTMPYVVRDDAALARLKPGDQIKADLVVDRKNYRVWLEHVQINTAGSHVRKSSPVESSRLFSRKRRNEDERWKPWPG